MKIECEGKEHPIIRNVDGEVSAIALALRHASRERITRVFGMCHVGHPEFFETIQRSIDENPGARILREGIHFNENKKRTKKRKDLERFWEKTLDDRDFIDEATDGQIVGQNDVFCLPKERVVKVDVSADELCEKLKKKDMEKIKAPGWYLEYRRNGEDKAIDIKPYLEAGLRIPIARYLTKQFVKMLIHREMTDRTSYTRSNDAFVHFRDTQLVEQILRLGQEVDLDIPWGAGHVPGIVEGMVASGEWNIDPATIRYNTFYSGERMFRGSVSFGTGKNFAPRS